MAIRATPLIPAGLGVQGHAVRLSELAGQARSAQRRLRRMSAGTPGCFCRKSSTSKACSYAASSLPTASWTCRPGLPVRPPAARSARATRWLRRRRRRRRRRRGTRRRREWAAREASREGGKERRRCGLRAGQALTACLHEATQHVRSVQGGWQKKKTPRTGPI
jgi:hypothetical protein